MRITATMVIVGLGLAGCGSSSTTSLSKAELAALPVTSIMPTGTAKYLGKMDSSTSGQRSNGNAFNANSSADFTLLADFNAKTVQGTMGSGTYTEVDGPNKTIIKFTSNAAGSGTISGSTFTIPQLTGNLTYTEGTLNGVAQPITQPVQSGSATSISANFIGDSAAGFYGKTIDNRTTFPTINEVYGTKQ